MKLLGVGQLVSDRGGRNTVQNTHADSINCDSIQTRGRHQHLLFDLTGESINDRVDGWQRTAG
jgi:hypothetical protein